ncbi:MAG: allophanate hydrolase, partial [Syntrophales bacterium]|nr:allophanate hydrolase [Syntrophales bacterium]
TGGYSKIATVISSDIPKIAQAVPGSRVRFRRSTLEEAHRVCREQALRMRELEAHLVSPR